MAVLFRACFALLIAACAIPNGAVAATTCTLAAAAAPDRRSPAEQSAVDLVADLSAGRAAAAYDRMTSEARAAQSAEAFAAIVPLFSSMQLKDPGVVRSWVLTSTPASPDVRYVRCGEGEVEVLAGPNPQEAHVLVRAKGVNNDFDIPVWLWNVGGQWRVNGFRFGTSTIAGHDVDAVLALARREKREGRGFNATLLYVAAGTLLDRGEAYRLPAYAAWSEEASTVAADPLLAGDLPHRWTLDGVADEITNIGVLGIAGELYVQIYRSKDALGSDEAIAADNEAFLDRVARADPAWAQAFSGLIVQTVEPSGRSYGSVRERKK